MPAASANAPPTKNTIPGEITMFINSNPTGFVGGELPPGLSAVGGDRPNNESNEIINGKTGDPEQRDSTNHL